MRVDRIKARNGDGLEYQIVLMSGNCSMRSFSEITHDEEELIARATELSQETNIPLKSWGGKFFARPTRTRTPDPWEKFLLRRETSFSDKELAILVPVAAGSIVTFVCLAVYLSVRLFG